MSKQQSADSSELKENKNTMKIKPNFFPTLLIVLDVLAAFGYLADGNWRKVVYWLAAGALTYVVTF